MSTYVLYNFTDTPEDFYERLSICVQLGRQLGIEIYPFPTKYIPLTAKDRGHVGCHWSRRLLRGVQCILLATRGLVSPNPEFFAAAFGHDAADFTSIALMPDDYVIHRRTYESNGAAEWRAAYRRLSTDERQLFLEQVADNRVTPEVLGSRMPRNVKDLLSHYVRSPRVREV